MKYRVCPYCQANLDHGERCDCRDKEEKREKETDARLIVAIDAYIARTKKLA